MERLICTECTLEIGSSSSGVGMVARHLDTDKPYHWSCLQEAYEREHLADERGNDDCDP